MIFCGKPTSKVFLPKRIRYIAFAENSIALVARRSSAISEILFQFKIKIYTASAMVSIEYEGQRVPLLWEELFQLADIIKEIKNGH
jgi:hypothetical protein